MRFGFTAITFGSPAGGHGPVAIGIARLIRAPCGSLVTTSKISTATAGSTETGGDTEIKRCASGDFSVSLIRRPTNRPTANMDLAAGSPADWDYPHEFQIGCESAVAMTAVLSVPILLALSMSVVPKRKKMRF